MSKTKQPEPKGMWLLVHDEYGPQSLSWNDPHSLFATKTKAQQVITKSKIKGLKPVFYIPAPKKGAKKNAS